MELGVRQFRRHEQFPMHSMEIGVRQVQWHEQFHGIPWNFTELWLRQFRWQETAWIFYHSISHAILFGFFLRQQITFNVSLAGIDLPLMFYQSESSIARLLLKKINNIFSANWIIFNYWAHRGRVTYICVGNVTNIGSDNGMLLGRLVAKPLSEPTLE